MSLNFFVTYYKKKWRPKLWVNSNSWLAHVIFIYLCCVKTRSVSVVYFLMGHTVCNWIFDSYVLKFWNFNVKSKKSCYVPLKINYLFPAFSETHVINKTWVIKKFEWTNTTTFVLKFFSHILRGDKFGAVLSAPMTFWSGRLSTKRF